MTGFHLTPLDVAALVVALLILALWLWIQCQMRRDEREKAALAVPLPDAPDEVFAAIADELEAGAYAAYAAEHPMRVSPSADRVAQGLDDLFLRLGPPPLSGLVEPGDNNTLDGENA